MLSDLLVVPELPMSESEHIHACLHRRKWRQCEQNLSFWNYVL